MYPTDFEADTSHLTLAEDGAYNRLMRLCWMTAGCSLPDDDAWIMRRMRCTTDEDCTIVANIIEEFFDRKGGRVTNRRLAREYQKTDLAHKKRVQAGSMGGKAKSRKSLENGSSNAKAMLKQPEPEPEPYIKPPKSPKGDCPFFLEFWEAYPHCKRRTDKPRARVLFAKIIAGKHPQIPKTEPAEIIAGAKAYTASGPDHEYVPIPTKWLNGERWTVSHLPAAKKYGKYV